MKTRGKIEMAVRHTKRPCTAIVDGNKCFDVWQTVKCRRTKYGTLVAIRGQVVKCYTHGHPVGKGGSK